MTTAGIQKYICLLGACLLLLSVDHCIAKDHVPVFRKLNSGTKAPIRTLCLTDGSCTYFLSDKLFTRNGSVWEKIPLPVLAQIDLIVPFKRNDFWFVVNTPLNSSELYHVSGEITEKINSPFANEIRSIFFPNPDFGIFAGWGELEVYCKGKFKTLPAPPSSLAISKIFGLNEDRIWLLSDLHELFLLDNKVISRLLEKEEVRDFYFREPDHGYVLSRSRLYEVRNGKFYLLRAGSELDAFSHITATGKGKIWLAGKIGAIAVIQDGTLKRFDWPGKEDIEDIKVDDREGVWIGGDKGLLLYSGSENFPSQLVDQPGFTRMKTFEFGRDADDEYGVAIADFNSDGLPDIYSICIFNPNRLYINYSHDINRPEARGRTFREEALKRGATGITRRYNNIPSSELQLGVTVCDIENDGDADIYICSLNGRNKLLINDGKGNFKDVSDERGRACEDLARSNCAAFADVDNDGDADLFVTSEFGSNSLFTNDGTGHFTDITSTSGLQTQRGGMCCMFGDINNDGLQDLCVSFWMTTSRVYLNKTRKGRICFADITKQTDIGSKPADRSNAVVFADVNNDGNLDLLITGRNSSNQLYINNGHGLLRDSSESFLNKEKFLGYGAIFADFDLDGFQDLYLSNVGENKFYLNIKGHRFTEVTSSLGTEMTGYATGSATGDIDNDGDIDFYAANYIQGSSLLFINNINRKIFAKFVLEGTRSCRDATGARVLLFHHDTVNRESHLVGLQEISGGGGYGSVNSRALIFGVNPREKYSAKVMFPASGTIIVLEDIRPGGVYRVKEESGIKAHWTLVKKTFHRTLIDPNLRIRLAEYLIIFISVIISFVHLLKMCIIRKWILLIIYLLIIAIFILISQVINFGNPLLDAVIVILIPMLILLFLHLLHSRMRLKKNALLELQKVRENISRDLHDDLASTLGSISIYSSTLRESSRVGSRIQEDLPGKIAELARNALQSVSDIIWMTSPKHDSLESLLSKIRNYYYDLMNDTGILFRCDIESVTGIYELSDKLRHDIFLILKEAASNIVRHSGAGEVSLTARIEQNQCIIEVNDNGKGFDPGHIRSEQGHGNGLVNMRRRAEESKLNLYVMSTVGRGTAIIVHIKMT